MCSYIRPMFLNTPLAISIAYTVPAQVATLVSGQAQFVCWCQWTLDRNPLPVKVDIQRFTSRASTGRGSISRCVATLGKLRTQIVCEEGNGKPPPSSHPQVA